MSVWHKTCTNNGMTSILYMFAAALLVAGSVPAFAQDTSGLIDPTRPHNARSVDREAPATGPVLQSTIVSDDERRAMISGRFYRVGDTLGAARIVEIQPNRVTLRRGDVLTTLSLYSRVVPTMKRQALASN